MVLRRVAPRTETHRTQMGGTCLEMGGTGLAPCLEMGGTCLEMGGTGLEMGGTGLQARAHRAACVKTRYRRFTFACKRRGGEGIFVA